MRFALGGLQTGTTRARQRKSSRRCACLEGVEGGHVSLDRWERKANISRP